MTEKERERKRSKNKILEKEKDSEREKDRKRERDGYIKKIHRADRKEREKNTEEKEIEKLY